MCSMPSKCPKCGSDNVDKEYYLGAQTGDWICGDCKDSGWIGKNYEHPTKKVTIRIDGEDAGSLMAAVATKPDENGFYGFLKKENLGKYEVANPVPIELKDGVFVAEVPNGKL